MLWFRIFVPDLRVLGFDLFRPFEGANQTKKKQHCNWGCGGLLDYKGLNSSSTYGTGSGDQQERRECEE